jgi:hypothetical protein
MHLKLKIILDASYSLKDGLDKTLEHEFINPKKDEFLFFLHIIVLNFFILF